MCGLATQEELVTGVSAIRFGVYTLDPVRHALTWPSGSAQLSPLASRLLQVLAERPGEVVERAALIEDLWRGDYLVGDPALNRVVSELRRAVGEDKRAPTLLQTVPRRGYRLVAAADESPPEGGARRNWPEAWRLANVTLAILLGSFVVVFALAIVSRWLR